MTSYEDLAARAARSGNTGYSYAPEGASGWSNFIYQASGDAARNNFTAAEAEKTRAFNSAEAAKDREWQTYMSNTAHQRAMADMAAAGINPMLAAGSEASTPSGAAASAQSAASTSGKGMNIGAIIGKIAAIAIAKGLEAKFTNSALKAADNHKLVASKVKALAAQEKANTARAMRDIGTSFTEEEANGVRRYVGRM